LPSYVSEPLSDPQLCWCEWIWILLSVYRFYMAMSDNLSQKS
jgi:hypothetical protein